jgi:hypothetical protein
MTKKLLGVFTTVVAALAVVGVAWASGDDGTSTSVTAATETSADVSTDASTLSTEATVPGSSSSTSVDASTSTSADAATSTSVDDDPGSTTSTSIAATTSTSAAGTTSTSIDDDDDTTTSTTIDDDNDRSQVPDGVTSHVIPGVGTVTIEASAGQIFLASVSAPGWNVEHDKIESDRIELEFTNELDADAEFEARINDGRVEVRIEVDLD